MQCSPFYVLKGRRGSMRFLLGSRNEMERKCRALLFFILSPSMLFNFQNVPGFHFRKKVKILRELKVDII